MSFQPLCEHPPKQSKIDVQKFDWTSVYVTAREGKGRTVTSKSFHSLRHTFVSQLANSGVPSEIRQRLIGHSDSGVHKKYTHLELQGFRDAVAKIPPILLRQPK
jgi:site-specific recombinase XerD